MKIEQKQMDAGSIVRIKGITPALTTKHQAQDAIRHIAQPVYVDLQNIKKPQPLLYARFENKEQA